MTDPPIPRLDPERLRSERQDLDFGENETGFEGRTKPGTDESEQPPGPAEPTAGITPPAR